METYRFRIDAINETKMTTLTVLLFTHTNQQSLWDQKPCGELDIKHQQLLLLDLSTKKQMARVFFTLVFIML